MKDKVILVTGANRGIGLNILQRLDNDGYTVIGTSRSDDGSNLISKHIKSSDGIGLKMDVTDQDSINSAISDFLRTILRVLNPSFFARAIKYLPTFEFAAF